MRQLSWHNWLALFTDWHVFAEGLGQTVLASVLALALSIGIGLVMGTAAVAPWRPLKVITRVYVEFFQNTPLLVQVFFLYYGLGYLKVDLSALAVGVIGLSVYTGAYITEIVRAGIAAIHRGQLEAAYSQGMTYLQSMRHIVLPQAMRVITPPLSNQFVNLIKNSSILAFIAGGDLTYNSESWHAENFKYGVAFIAVNVLYLSLTLPMSALTRHLEKRMAIPGQQTGGGGV